VLVPGELWLLVLVDKEMVVLLLVVLLHVLMLVGARLLRPMAVGRGLQLVVLLLLSLLLVLQL
jgi:hypothetical protein